MAKAKLTAAAEEKAILQKIKANPGVFDIRRQISGNGKWKLYREHQWGWPGDDRPVDQLVSNLELTDALKAADALVDYMTYLPPGIVSFGPIGPPLTDREGWDQHWTVTFTNGEVLDVGPRADIPDYVNRNPYGELEGGGWKTVKWLEKLADEHVGKELEAEIRALPQVASLQREPDYGWVATFTPGYFWTIPQMWRSSSNDDEEQIAFGSTLSALRAHLDQVELKLSAAPPDWRPAEAIPEDYYVGAGKAVKAKAVKAKAGAKAKLKADDKTKPPMTNVQLARARIKATITQRPAAKLNPAQEKEIIKEIKAHPGVVGLDFLKFPLPEESTWRAELNSQWGWPGNYEHAFITLRNLPDVLKAVNELVDLNHYLPPGVVGTGQSLTSDDWTIQFTNGKTTTHEDHGSGGVRHRIFTMEALADKYAGEQLQEEIKALPSIAALQRVADHYKVTMGWNAYLNLGFGWDVPGILPTFTVKSSGETYITSPTLSQLVYMLRSIVDVRQKVGMQDVDWRPNESIPEDYYANVGAGKAKPAKAAKVKPSKAKQLTPAQEQAMVREIKSHPGVFTLEHDHYNEGWVIVPQSNWGWPAEDADSMSTAIPNIEDVLKLARSMVDFRTYLPPGIESFGPSDRHHWLIKFSDGSSIVTDDELTFDSNVPLVELIGRLSTSADEHIGPFLQAEIRAMPSVDSLTEDNFGWIAVLKPGYDKDVGMFRVRSSSGKRYLMASTLSEMLAMLYQVKDMRTKVGMADVDWRPNEVIPEDYYAEVGAGKQHSAPAHADRCDALCKLYPGSVHCLDSQAATECATAVLAAFDARMHHESTFRGVLFSVEDHGFKMLHLAPGGGTLADFVKRERGGAGPGAAKRSKRSARSYVLLTKGHVMAWRNGKLTDTTELGAKGEGGARPLLAVATFAEVDAQPEEEF
jgi:hypothetical protein